MGTSSLVSNTRPSSGGRRENSSTPWIPCDWDLEVERGPNWLFVTVHGWGFGVSEEPPLADQLESLMKQHLINRIVLEFDQSELPFHDLVQQLDLIDQWLGARNGMLRLCGLSTHCADELRRCGLDGRFPIYRNRHDAVFGVDRPQTPR